MGSGATVRVGAVHGDVQLEPGDPDGLGPWRLLGRLGAGGMGVVYLGVDAGGALAAVKTVRRDLLTDPAAAARFRREVRLSAQVTGPCTATLLGADVSGPLPWFAVEYVAGCTLDAHVSSEGPLAAGPVRTFATALARALEDIHAVGVTHRDLTPTNVILAPEGPKVVDFGIARSVAQTAVTSTGTTIGTPGYIAPEVIRGADATAAADVFAWATLVCFAATGRSPFGAGPTDQLLFRVLEGRAEVPALPQELESAVCAAFAVDPGSRPDAGTLVRRLATVAPPGAAVTARLAKEWSVTVPLVDLGVSQSPTRGGVPSTTRPTPSDGPAPRRWPVVAAVLTAVLAVGGLGVAVLSDGEVSTAAEVAAAPESARVAETAQRPDRADEVVADAPDPDAAEDPEADPADDDEPAAPVDEPEPATPEPASGTGGLGGSYQEPPAQVDADLRERGFVVQDATFWDPDSTLAAVIGMPEGSATGRGRYVFFYAQGHGLLGTDALEPSESIAFAWRDDTTIAIDYVLYQQGDPGCCPTAGATTVRFSWDGRRLHALDEIPPTEGPVYR